MTKLFGLAPIALGLVATACSRTPSPLTPTWRTGTIGAPARGVLVGGTELPASGPGYQWWNPVGHHYGVARFVRAIENAAAKVAVERPGTPPLMVGDISARSGGEIPGHHSHRSGRDVDLLFYALTPEGAPLQSPGFIKFGPDGLGMVPADRGGPKYIRLDVEREWLLMKALMESEDANVQWMFVSIPVEGLISEYARARGEDPELVWHAETVMLQPGDSLPHDDHLHLRSACLPDEAIGGCEGGGPYWAWNPPLPDGVPPESDDSLLTALLAPVAPSPGPLVTVPATAEAAGSPMPAGATPASRTR